MTVDRVRNALGVVPARVDGLGTLASAACALHCTLVAFAPAAFATIGLGALLGDGSEWGFTAAATAFAAAALVMAWRRHRSRRVVGMLGGGMIALLLARFFEEPLGDVLGMVSSVLASALIIAGHLTNLAVSRGRHSSRARVRSVTS